MRYRSDQIRYTSPWPSNPAHAVTTPIQTVGREAIQGWYRKDGEVVLDGG